MTNPDGATVDGGLGADQRSWSSSEPLGYGRTYRLTATGTDPAEWLRSQSVNAPAR